jgi:hypothetical protein
MLRDPQNFTGKDLLGVAMAYSRTQNFSEEFLFIFEQAVWNKIEELNPREIVIILHSLKKNYFKSERILAWVRERLEDGPKGSEWGDRFAPSDLANLLGIFAHWNVWELGKVGRGVWEILIVKFCGKKLSLNSLDFVGFWEAVV